MSANPYEAPEMADRTGIYDWPANEEIPHFTTPLISVIATPIVYWLAAFCTFTVVWLRTRPGKAPGAPCP